MLLAELEKVKPEMLFSQFRLDMIDNEVNIAVLEVEGRQIFARILPLPNLIQRKVHRFAMLLDMQFSRKVFRVAYDIRRELAFLAFEIHNYLDGVTSVLPLMVGIDCRSHLDFCHVL
jgi:hypothetical protein